MSATEYNHLFLTFLGLPPAKGIDLPLCGADLPDDWDFRGAFRLPCPACQEAARLRGLS
jgi:hypothetical protein